MIKFHELTNPRSCLSKAREDEMLFVLLARDAAAPATIRFWVTERIRLGKNTENDKQIQEALACAWLMEHQRESKTKAAQHDSPNVSQGLADRLAR